MKTKSIQQILAPPPAHMVGNGFRVHNFFPNGYDMKPDRMSPFFLLDYNAKMDFSPRETPRGVGVHPHRGFETVTIAYHGAVAHADSRGNRGVIEAGDVQWMTAASGVLHKEYHEDSYSKRGGPFQMVQLWINLPAKDKMSPPKYQAIRNDSVPKYELPENKGNIEVIAGHCHGVKGVADTFTPIELYNIRMEPEAKVSLELPVHYNTGILVIEGEAFVQGTERAVTDHFVLFRNDGERIDLETQEKSGMLLLMSGEPISEPIVSYGPFLMNTKEEILEAIQDVRDGKFGYLED